MNLNDGIDITIALLDNSTHKYERLYNRSKLSYVYKHRPFSVLFF